MPGNYTAIAVTGSGPYATINGYNGIPKEVFGPPAFTLGNTNAFVATGMLHPVVFVEPSSGALLVSDAYLNRVLVWRSMPTSNNQPPDLVLGQPDFNTCAFGRPQHPPWPVPRTFGPMVNTCLKRTTDMPEY